jgi:alkylation response protein AidB-like acyl-CoA dehydrogenase
VSNNFSESEERQALRKEVSKLAGKYGREYFTEKARSGGKTTDLWLEIGKNGYLGINIPEEYGGGGGGIGDIAAVCEELAAQGCPLLMMVVSPAICGTSSTLRARSDRPCMRRAGLRCTGSTWRAIGAGCIWSPAMRWWHGW